MPELPSDVSALSERFKDAAAELSEKLSDMLFATGQRLQQLYREVLRLLNELREFVSAWAEEFITSAFRESDARTIAELAFVDSVIDVWEPINQQSLDREKDRFLALIGGAVVSLQGLAGRALRGASSPAFFGREARDVTRLGGPRSVGEAQQRRLRNLARTRIRSNIVEVLGRNGRVYRYSADYYAALVAHQARQEAIVQAALTRSLQNGIDLVRISSNRSTVGDYCNAYRGLTVSISGNDTRFPSVVDLPGGTLPPWHPWCRHTVQPTSAPPAPERAIPERLRQLTADPDAGPNEFQKVWRELNG